MTGLRSAPASPGAPVHGGVDANPSSTNHEIVVQLSDADVAYALRELIRRLPALLSCGRGTIVIDVSGMTQLSSATVAALLWIRRRCRSHGMVVVLRHPSRKSVEMLRRTGLQGALPVEQQDGERPSGRAAASPPGRPAR